jgi:integrase
MNRKLYLECIKNRWYAVEHFERFENGEIKIARRRHTLGIVGKDKRKAAEKALRSLEVEIAMLHRDELVTEEVSVLEYAERFLAGAALDVRPSTLRSYQLWIRRFVLIHGQLQLGAIRPSMIEAWKIELADGLAPSTVNVALRSLRVMFGKATRQGVISRNPFDHVSFVDVPRRGFPPFWTPDQYNEFIEVVTAPRQRAAIALAFYAGLRARETVTLRWKDLKTDHIEIVSRADARTKGDRSRRAPLYAPLQAELDLLPRLGDYVLSSKHQQVADERILSRRFLEHRRLLPHLPEITFHGLRHSFATNLALAGVPVAVLQKLLGHQDIQTTMLYTHVERDAAVDVALRVNPFG